MSVVLDVPQRPVAADVAGTYQMQQIPLVRADTARPAIERVLDADRAVEMLPRDHPGNIDWMAALNEGVIKPRAAIPGEETQFQDFVFGFDFFFPGPAPTFDAFFPHSSHTAWVDCQQCHARIFKYRGTEIRMADVLQGKYCGECHGKVAFPPTTGCERCHRELPQQAGRAQPDLLGTIRMRRVVRDSASVDATVQTTAKGAEVNASEIPPAVFPHWVHRIQYKCKTCHMAIFEPKAGENEVTMSDITAGQACGRCHNGTVAFAAGFGQCQRCHQSVDPSDPQ